MNDIHNILSNNALTITNLLSLFNYPAVQDIRYYSTYTGLTRLNNELNLNIQEPSTVKKGKCSGTTNLQTKILSYQQEIINKLKELIQ